MTLLVHPLGLAPLVALLASSTPPTTIELFTRADCPRCLEARRTLEALDVERADVELRISDVVADSAARARLDELARLHGIHPAGVPAIAVKGSLFVGFRERERMLALIHAALEDGAERSANDVAGETCTLEASECPSRDEVEVPLFGVVSPRAIGLPLFTIVLGLVDGFNPCAMWVLLFLLSLLVNLRDRKKMLLIAGVFVVMSGAVYFAFMAAWLNLFLFVGLSRAVQVGLGVLALAAGAIHVKDFFAFHRGVTLSIPERAKPTLYAHVRRILSAESVWAALLAAVVLAFVVNIVELLCTAGIPALYTEVLALQDQGTWKHYAYLVLYNVAYMFDDAVMVSIAVVSFGKRRLEEKEGRWLKLVSGAVMVVLGALLIARPGWLSP